MANWVAGANVLSCYAISQSNFTDAQLTLLQPGGVVATHACIVFPVTFPGFFHE